VARHCLTGGKKDSWWCVVRGWWRDSWSWFYEIFILRSKVQIRPSPSAEQAERRRETVMDEKYNTATPLHLESSAKDKYVKSVHFSLIAKCEISAHLVHITSMEIV